ncbi:winged helix-turn-helix domain-containing protein [Kineosporia rhizophila]|uniref:winged helix-turn-helix domain-containing protein n=1 Tax=Kineosporia rhizophila TaxID=84633 RepID=UPI001E3B89D6|nr:winged helix-turn-helix domain-containing protein [Kineosporia rhizophila]MCE0539548.1 winged helix-turn-helix domain-containing protein [Kineosporia rhizophila]
MRPHDLPDIGVHLDPATRLLHGPAGATTLTTKQSALLSALLDAHADTVPRQNLLEAVWDVTWVGAHRALDVHIAALRARLAATGGPHGPRIETVRGLGYRLVPPGP